MLEIVKWVFAGIIPPTNLEDKEAMRRWMFAVFTTLTAWSGVTIILTLLIFGGFQAVFPGFALASDMQNGFKNSNDARIALQNQMQSDTRDIKTIILSGQILAQHVAECNARKEHNQALASNISGQISNLQTQYMRVNNGQQFPVESCN